MMRQRLFSQKPKCRKLQETLTSFSRAIPRAFGAGLPDTALEHDAKCHGQGRKACSRSQKHSNTIWWILGGIAAVVAGYFIYKALTETPVPKPDYTVTFEVINHMLGQQKTFTRTGKEGTSATISSADWSDVANINPKYWVLREDGFGNYITDASDAGKTWSVNNP